MEGSSLLISAHEVVPQTPSFPVQNFQTSTEIDGVKTEFITSEFSDKLFFVITQIQKLGTLVLASKENIGEECYSTQVILGKRDDERIDFIARCLSEYCVTKGVIPPQKPILFAIGLQNQTTLDSVRKILKFAQGFL